MKAKRTDKATVIAVVVGVLIYLWNLAEFLWSFLPVVLGSARYTNWISIICWLLYLTVLLVVGTLQRRRSWLVAVGVSGVLGVLAVRYAQLNGPFALPPLLVFLMPYSLENSIWSVFPVAIFPWLLLALVIWLNRRATAPLAPTSGSENQCREDK